MPNRERLHELRRRRALMLAEMEKLIKQEEDPDGEGLSEDQSNEFEKLRTELAKLDGRIQRLEAALAADAAASNGNGDGDGDGDGDGEAGLTGNGIRPRNTGGFRFRTDTTPATAKAVVNNKPGIRAATFAFGLMYARFHKLSLEKAAEFVETRFGDVSVAKALNTIVTGEGGALIPQDFLADLIELLRANTVVRGSMPMTIGMPMGNLTIPRLAGGSTAAYQGELDDIAISQERFDDVNFVAKKLTAMVPVSNDLIRRAPIGVEEVVRDDLIQTVARREDLAFLRGDGTDKGPIGFRTLCLPANIINIAAIDDITEPGAGLNAVVAALSAAMLTLQNGLSRMIKPVWIMAPTTARFIAVQRDNIGGFYYKDEMARGMLEGIPFKLTTQLPTNLGLGNGSEIYLAAFEDVVIADTYNVIVDASDVAAYNDGTAVVSTFQRDQSLFRVIAEHDFNMRHLQSLAILITVDWTFTGLAGLPGRPWTTQALNPTWSQAPAIRPATLTGAQAPPPLANPA
jgi:HK97 family phage major capsid protein